MLFRALWFLCSCFVVAFDVWAMCVLCVCFLLFWLNVAFVFLCAFLFVLLVSFNVFVFGCLCMFLRSLKCVFVVCRLVFQFFKVCDCFFCFLFFVMRVLWCVFVCWCLFLIHLDAVFVCCVLLLCLYCFWL